MLQSLRVHRVSLLFACNPQADGSNNLIRRLNISSGLVTTIAGSLSGAVGFANNGYGDGQGTAAFLSRPSDVAIDAGPLP